jgi:hypothetical protein
MSNTMANIQHATNKITNHQAHLKDFIASLVKIDFDKNNQYDLELEAQWESAVTECRKHTYFINPNDSIFVVFLFHQIQL